MTISSRINWKAALLTGLAVPSLTLAACSSDDGSSDSTDAAGANGDSGSSAGIGIPGTPDGFDVTKPDSKLSIDEVGHVVTKFQEGPSQFWDIRPGEFRDLPADAAELQSGAEDLDHFVCVDYEMTYRGAGSDGTNPDDERPLSDPEVTAIGDNGNQANMILMDLSNTCGIHEADELPHNAQELEVGKTYRDAKLSYVGKDANKGVNPTGISFRYETSISGLDSGQVYWNK